MQINRIQGNFNVLNQINNQTKSGSNAQNANLGQTANYLYSHNKLLSFGGGKVIPLQNIKLVSTDPREDSISP